MRLGALLCIVASVVGCAQVGPDFVPPRADVTETWQQIEGDALKPTAPELVEWWRVFEDPVLDDLVEATYRENKTLEAAGLRVLEARAQLGIAVGNKYPQLQRGRGGAVYVDASEGNANTTAGDLTFWQYDIGADVSWELDFWGRFRRGIESADANLLASIASYDDALVLLIAQVADTYTVIRATEEQLRIARENIVLQRRSYEMAEILFREGADSELDMQQARTLLLSTQATIPGLELTLQQARNALNTLLGRPPGELDTLLGNPRGIPAVPAEVAIGIPADLLRRRPDVRTAELLAAAQSARIGLAKADLYPSFTLSGSVGLAAASGTNTTRTGDSGIDGLLNSDSLTFSAGPGFTWNLLNYGRIKNNVRVQDARLQQLLVSYEDTVLRAAQEVEDALVALVRGEEQNRILAETVDAARRTVELSMLRYREGLSDYQRVLDAQQSLFAQQTRYVANQGNVIRSLVSMYRGLGGGWQIREGREFVDEETRTSMGERTDWGELLQPGAAQPPEVGNEDQRRKPDW